MKNPLLLIETLVDGRQQVQTLMSGAVVIAKPHATYAVIDQQTGITPSGLEINRKGNSLHIVLDEESIVQIDGFYNDAISAQYSLVSENVFVDDALISASEGNPTGLSSGDEGMGAFTLTEKIVALSFLTVAGGFTIADAVKNKDKIIIDKTAPSAPSITLSVDTGSSGFDRITNNVTVNVSGLENNAVWEYTLDGGASWVVGTGSSFDLANDTTYAAGEILVRQTDISRNVSEVNNMGGGVVTDMTISDPALALATDTGSSSSDGITNDTTVNVTLASDVASWEYSLDGGVNWLAGTGNSFELVNNTTYAAGTVQVRQTDLAGNTSAVVSSLSTITVDTGAPTTTISAIDISADTGTSTTDFTTKTAAQTITATLSSALVSGEVLYGSTDSGSTWIDITSKVTGTAISWDGATLTGSNTIQIKVVDVAGNAGVLASQAYVLDITPSATTIRNIDISADTGTSATDFVTSTAAQTITAVLGSALTSGDVLWGSLDGGTTWVDITSKASGTAISWDGAILSGSSSIQIKIIDAAGNEGAAVSQAYVLDTTAPAATITAIDISADTGVLDTDFNTSTAAQTITATLSTALVAGEILYGSVDGGTTWTNITAKAIGTAISWNGVTLSGSSSIEIKVTDAAGNDGAVASQAYVVDNTASTTTISAIDILDDAGKSATDFITKTAVQTITGTLSTALVAGEILYGSVDGGTTWVDITGKALGTAISWDGATLSGSSSIEIKVTDTAGNDGAVASQDYVLDTTAPTTTINTIDISVDTGTSDADFTTNTAAQTITATLSTALVAGETVYGSVDGGTTWVDLIAKVSGTTITWNTATLLSGSNSIILKVTDLAGNDGTPASQAYVLDTTAPATTITAIDISADTGTSNSDFLTNTDAQTISATLGAALDAGDVLWGSVDAGANWVDITSKAIGTAISWDGATLLGNSSIQIKIIDAAGNEGTVASQDYTLDTTAPSTFISSIDISDDTGKLATDFNTKTAAQTITGTLNTPLVAGEVLWGSVNGGSTWVDITSKAIGTAVSWDGATLSGSSSIQIKVVDAAGNEGTVVSQAYVLDVATTTTTVSAIDISADTGVSATDFETNTAAQTITATLSTALVAGEVLWGSVNGGSTWVDITNKASGTAISWDGATLSGSSSILIKVSDLAGNDNTATSVSYVLDITAPTTTISGIDISADTGDLATDFITNTAAQTITATLNTALVAGEILQGSVNGGISWTDITSKATGTAISWDGASLAGSQIRIKVTDTAGNDGTVATQGYVFDNAVPTTTITSAAYNVGSNTLTLTGANINTLLTGSETAVTDIKGNIDWSKLQWDINSDDTGNITFIEADIASARATDATTLTIVLNAGKALALEGAVGFDNLTTNDSIELASGFAVDTAGNAGTLSSPTQPDMSAASDTGTLDTDNITSNTTPTFTGTAAVGSTVTLTSSVDGNVGSVVADGSGNWSITASVLSVGAHNITASNTTGNVSVASSALPITIVDTDTSIVVFDLVSGQSSSHSSRMFDGATSYTIYIMVDSNSQNLTAAPQWTGGVNLGADDTVVLVGSGSAVIGFMSNAVTNTNYIGSRIYWSTGPLWAAATLYSTGFFMRDFQVQSDFMQIWTGAGTIVNGAYLTTLPAGIYTSQGL